MMVTKEHLCHILKNDNQERFFFVFYIYIYLQPNSIFLLYPVSELEIKKHKLDLK